jgi:guanine deaminase
MILRGPLLTPGPEGLRAIEDAVVTITGETLVEVRRAARGERADLDLRGRGLMIPGLVDAHVHFPQYPVRGIFGGELLPWLREHIWPEECRYAEPAHAAQQAPVFLDALLRAGTTTAAVYGSPHAHSVEPLLAARTGPTVLAGPAWMDQQGPEELMTSPAAAEEAMARLADRFGRGLVVTPRFAVSCSGELLAACGRVAARHGLHVQTHLSENPDEIELVARLFPDSRDYLDVYDRAGLLGARTLLAHAVHCSDDAFARIAAAGATVVHCPTSNVALHSGRMPLERVVAAGTPVCLGSDVGGGPDLCMLDVLRCLVEQHAGICEAGPETSLPLATRAGALALGFADRGWLVEGARADITVLRRRGCARDPVGAYDEAVRAHETGAEDSILATVCGGEVLDLTSSGCRS